MKILLVIDHLGSGGAQRQIVELACGLKKRGHEVEMFIYFPHHDFFRSRVVEKNITIHEYSKVRRFSFGVVLRLAALIRKGSFDVVVSYLKSANSYTELAKLMSGGAVFIVSERTSHHDDKSWIASFSRRMLHILADQVVANSMTHCAWLKKKWWLKNKVTCIYNGLDLDAFYPAGSAPKECSLVGIGRIGPEKNIINLIRALELFHSQFGYAPQVNWAGLQDKSPAGQAYCHQVDKLLDSLPAIRNRWKWLSLQSDVLGLLQRHYALIHPSSYEGLPNVVCEGLAVGLPILASDVCDHSVLVADGERGFLFDPDDPQSISSAIENLVNLDAERWHDFSCNARKYALAELSAEKMVVAYENLFVSLLGESADKSA